MKRKVIVTLEYPENDIKLKEFRNKYTYDIYDDNNHFVLRPEQIQVNVIKKENDKNPRK